MAAVVSSARLVVYATTEEDAMNADVGDRLVVHAHHLGEPERDAEILEVMGKNGLPPYRVRWSDDGHEGIVFPGSDASVEHLEHHVVKRTRAKGPMPSQPV